MSEHYMGRNGTIEQVRFYRQEPRYIRNLPWDFEQSSKRKRHIVAETIIVLFIVLTVGWMFYSVYAK